MGLNAACSENGLIFGLCRTVDERSEFQRFYVGLAALLHGWARGLRARIGLACAAMVAALCLMTMPQTAHASGSGTSGDPFTTLADAYTVPSSGRYFFNTGSGLFEASVDTSEGGGWVLVLQYVHQGTTNPSLSVKTAGSNLPILSTAALGTDESADLTRWGHAGNAAMSQFQGDIEFRWYGRSSAHSRVIHFRSSIGDDYARTGAGDFTGIASSFTALTGHTANLPASINNRYISQGDLAFTAFPFYTNGTYHWGIRGSGASRWEADDFTATSGTAAYANDTIHRVWVRSAAPLQVTNTNDSGEGSLRAAMSVANGNTSLDAITFNITGTGPHTITLTSALPTITDAGVSIDGTSQSGASCGDLWAGTPHALKIQIDANGGAFHVLNANAANISIRGLSLTGAGSSNSGLLFGSSSSGSAVTCSYIGLDTTGAAAGNGYGVYNQGASTIIGGASGSGNVISANSDFGIRLDAGTSAIDIRGNFIGTNPAGSSASANGTVGISNNAGSSAGISIAQIRDNLISGNASHGVLLRNDHPVTGSPGDVVFAGNYVGVDRTGLVALGNGNGGIQLATGSIGNVTVGGTSVSDRNIFGGNISHNLYYDGTGILTVLGNYFGIGSDGTTAIASGSHAVRVDGGVAIIGNGAASGRNIMAATDLDPIQLKSTGTATVDGNYIGTDASGNVAISTAISGGDGISVNAGSTVYIRNNVIGTVPNSAIEFINAATFTTVEVTGNTIGIGANGSSNIGNADSTATGITFKNGITVTDALVSGNTIANLGGNGIFIDSGTDGASLLVTDNDLYDLGSNGVSLLSGKAAIYANSIYNNGGLAIDLGDDGVTANDSGDGDTGPNDLLNFPVINALNGSGTTSLTYSFNLDVPSNPTNGYRVEFYKNSTADASGHGEGETYLGFVDIAHSGGDTLFTGTLTTAVTVSPGDIISATTTRKTGASSFDITSEFGQNNTIVTPLTVINTNDSGAGSLRNAITYANANTAEDAITFAIAGTGPHLITLASGLPAITDAGISIDGTTQSGAACGDLWAGTQHTIQIQIDGNGGAFDVLDVNAANVSVRGLSLTGAAASNSGIRFNPASSASSLTCSYVGITPARVARSNGYGVHNNGTNITIGGAAGNGNVISSNTTYGIRLNVGTTALNVEGNFIGMSPDGTTAMGNGSAGISNNIGSSAGITISQIRRNLISGNGNNAISFTNANPVSGSAGDLVIAGNYIGLAMNGSTRRGNGGHGINMESGSVTGGVTIGGTSTGDRNVISGNASASNEINLVGVSNVSILGNYLGVDASGNSIRGVASAVIYANGASGLTIGNGASSGRNIVGSNGSTGIELTNGTTVSVIGNRIGVGADGTSNVAQLHLGIAAGDNVVAQITDNIIANSRNNDGIELSSPTARAAIMRNSIYGNAEDGIELDGSGSEEGPNANDAGDTDTGPNDNLNYPVINALNASGTTSLTYSFNLDVPAADYRIEFFRNTTPDANGYGEGETYLGYVDITHGGAGSQLFTGSATMLSTVSIGDIISATTTRKTGADSFDITSEFAQNRTIVTPLTVSTTADSGAGSLRNAITYANANTGEDAITFGIAGAGPHTITLASALPVITDAGISIDGTTQSGAACGDLWAGTPHTLLIRLHAAAQAFDVLSVNAANVSLRGLSITGAGSSNTGVLFGASSSASAITCSYVGLSTTGVASANGRGIGTTGNGTTIGGLTAGDGNVISGNTNSGIYSYGTNRALSIRGNFIGTDPLGTSARANGTYGITNSVSTGAVTWNEVRRNLISGNTLNGIYLGNANPVTPSATNVVFAGNYIGVNRTGNVALGNGQSGIQFTGTNAVDSLLVGGTNAADRNIISGNTNDGIHIENVQSRTFTFLGNYIGLGADGTTQVANTRYGLQLQTASISGSHYVYIGNGTAAGRNVISGHSRGIFSWSSSRAIIDDSYFGTDATGQLARPNGTAMWMRQFSLFTISNAVISGNSSTAIQVESGADLAITRSKIGVAADGVTALGNGGSGISVINDNGAIVTIGDGIAANGNIIANNTVHGIVVTETTTPTTVLANSIYNNGGPGIDLGNDGVTANDAGDGDSGANGLLNYPVLRGAAVQGGQLSYNFDLDVPTSANGYRIDFYANDVADASGASEGKTWIGSINTGSYAGGVQNFSGSFAAQAPVSQGAFISLTATLMTGASTYGGTSEFSVTVVGGSPDLVVTMNSTVPASLNDNIFHVPGNDVFYTMTVTNTGTGATDSGSMALIAAVPTDTTFFNGATADFGGNVVSFDAGDSTLSFDEGSGLAFSNSGTRPATFADCTYTPAAGYDAAITYICLKPSGSMPAATPNPSFSLTFRARVD